MTSWPHNIFISGDRKLVPFPPYLVLMTCMLGIKYSRYLENCFHLWIIRPILITLDANIFMFISFLFPGDRKLVPFPPIFGLDDVMLGIKYSRYLKYCNASIFELSALYLLWMQIFMFISFLFQEIESWSLFPHIWSWWRHAGDQIFEISENCFHFWIIRPIFTLGASFYVHVVFLSGDKELVPMPPHIWPLDDIMMGVKNWHFTRTPFFQLLTQFSSSSAFFP